MLLVSFASIGTSAASVYERPQKHIYLVLDDSGSMSGQYEHDANYALQTLVAMTDKTDTLTIYFLNQSSKISGELNLKNKSNKMLENIKVNYPYTNGGTPYDAVKTAQNDLRNAVSADDKGEYWLIVVTDGGFNASSMDYEKDLMNFAKGLDANGKEAPLKNGDCPNVMCVSIGFDSIISDKNQNTVNNLYTIDNMDVIPSMNEAAKIISNRIEVKKIDYSSDKKAITFDVPYPARNIVVFTQKAKTSVTDYTSSSKLNISEKYNVSRSNVYQGFSSVDFTSTVCFVTENSGKSITSGEMTLKFDKALVPENTVVLIEPAIGLSAQFYNQDGQKCDPSELRIGEKAKLVYTICDPDTNKPIDESTIDGGVTYSATLNDDTYNSNTVEFTVESDELIIDLSAKFTDGFALDIHDEYTGMTENIILSLTLSDGGNFSADINTLDDSYYITATPAYNGNPLSEEEIKNSTLEIRVENFFTSQFKIEPDPQNGTFKIIPRGGIFKVITPVLTEVDVVFTSQYGQEISEKLSVELTGERNWLPIILTLIGIAVLIYLIVIYSIKPKFPLDLQLYSYNIVTYKTPVNIKNTSCSPKTVFHPGVIDFWSALPWKHPFKIRLGTIDPAFEGIMLVATSGGMAIVQNVKEITYVDSVTQKKKTEPSFRVINSKQDKKSAKGYATQNSLSGMRNASKYGDKVLVLKNSEFLQQHPKSVGNPKKLLRYIRKQTQKKNGEI